MNALKGLDFKRSATTLFSMYIKYLMYSFFTGWLFHSAWQSLVLAVTKIRFRRFRRFSKVCQEPFPAFEQVSSQKVESIQWYVCDIGTTKIFVIYFFNKILWCLFAGKCLAIFWQFFWQFLDKILVTFQCYFGLGYLRSCERWLRMYRQILGIDL